MYYAIVKLEFDLDVPTRDDIKKFYNLSQKIKSKFKISVLSSVDICKDAKNYYIACAILGKSPQSISATIDKVISICEQEGIGRIISENSILDHIDDIDEV